MERRDSHHKAVANGDSSTSTNFMRKRSLPSGSQTLANSMKKVLYASNSKPRRLRPHTIYRVPQRIRQGNREAYEPQILSIGPYHRGKKNLESMEDHKWRYLQAILSRNPNRVLEDYLEEIKELEDEARCCYSEQRCYKSNEFVKMMVLDGCFIVELFLKLKEELREVDPIFSTIWMLPLIGYDLLLLENQIPFFILQCIWDLVSLPDKPNSCCLAENALEFFDQFMPRNREIPIKDSDFYHHLLHLFHSHLIPNLISGKDSSGHSTKFQINSNSTKWNTLLLWLRSKGFLPNAKNCNLPIQNPTSPSAPCTIKMIPCATELQLAGIKFRKKEKSNSILDVKFSNGVLEMTPLSINSFTNSLFRNLVAFEQCYPNLRIRFTTYVFFMDCIINTCKDVALLHRNGIIDHLLGSDDEVAQLFNRLGNGAFDFENNYLSELYKQVEIYRKTNWNMWMATLRRDYFSTPWAILSTIAALIFLTMTIIQAVFAALAYFRPP